MSRFRNPTPEESRRLSRWRLSTFWVMLLGYVGYYLVRGNLSVAMPLLSQELGYTNTDLAIILTVSEIVYSIGKFTTGPLADKIGGKNVFLVGMAGAIVFNLLFPLHSSILYFTIIWSLCRYSLSMGWGGIMKTIGAWYEPERTGTVMGLISINFQFGGVAAALFAGWLVSLGMGWQALFTIPAGVVAGVFVWSALASRESPAQVVPGVKFGSYGARKPRLEHLSHENDAPLSFSEIFRTLMGVRLFRQIVVFSFVMHLLRSTFMYWTPKILVDLGLGNVAAAMSSAVFPLMGCIGTIFIGWYTDRFSKDGNRTGMMSLMLAGLVGCMAGIAFLIPAQGDASSTAQLGIVALLGISGFLMYGPYSLSAGAMALDLVGARAIGTCTGIIDGVGYIGGAVASWGAGVLADHAGWREVFVALAAVSGFCAFWSWHMGRSNWPARLTVLLFVLASGCSSLEVQGHRGARGLRPENTIPAFDYALKLGVDVLELDLGVSKDEKLVIYHDQRINPVICSGSPAVPVYSLTSKKLSQIDCGSRRNPRFPEQVLTPGATIPTLDGFFEWIKHHPDRAARKVRFNIETKIEEAHPELAPPPDRFARLVIETLRRHDMVARTVLQSFDFRTLVEARRLEPRLETAILLEDRPSEDMVLIAQRIGAQMISPQHEWLTEKDVRQIHAARLKVIPWTVNAMADFERLKAIGVDGIITDYPDRLIPLARSRTTQ